MRLLHRSRRLLAAALCLAAVACGDGTGPDAGVAGTYEAISIIFTSEAGGTEDLYAEGGRISLSLTSAGTTTGSLSFATPTGQEIISLAGTYVHDEAAGTVVFTQESDTIIRDITWTVTGAQLRGTFVDTDGVLAITLARRA
jgi:hypothetical protein